MRYIEITNRLAETLSVDSTQFRAWFGNSKVVDGQGNPLPVYHGTGRPDRVGTVFRRSRATAGPMAYFTDDPAIASGYAAGKPDTSFEGEESYAGWFKVKIPGSRSFVDISRAWYFLNGEQRQRISELAPRITRDEDNIYLADVNHRNGIGNLDYAVQQARGNYLAGLVDGWLAGGTLFGDEREFLTVLKLAEFPYPVEMHNPHETFPAVYAVFLSIRNPLDTRNIPQKVVDDLTKAAQRMRSNTNQYDYNWDKSATNPRLWVRSMLDDIESGANLHWTVVPDWVTKVLQSLGYDGIQDRGGKHHVDGHTVWIPFTETQVKSAISNRNFDPTKKNIHH